MIHLRDIEAIRSYLDGGNDRDFACRTPRTREEVVKQLDKLISELSELSKNQAYAQVAINLITPKVYSQEEAGE